MRLILERKEIEHLASLVRIALSESDLEILQTQLPRILKQFEILNEIETSKVEPTGHAVAIESVMRDDDIEAPLSSAEVLQNAPNSAGEYIRVKAILEE
jgi:aspartyl-tRNA(Asn)/glutamyl-tRNA(Gln) amidotransferase subunit C